MTDHADTIRRAITGITRHDAEEAFAALDALLAERQQAIDERAEQATECEALRSERDVWKGRTHNAEARCEQAIDALREIAQANAGTYVAEYASAALQSLGEQP